jgi:hypothetical protein
MKNHAAYPDRTLEWLFATMMAAWGCYLFLPLETFDNPQYALLKALSPEKVWGAFSIAIAALRMVALTINGWWYRTPALRCLCAVLGVVWWCAMIFLLLAVPQAHPAAGLVWYPVFAVFEGVVCWRAGADAFHSKAFRLRPLRRGAPALNAPA